MRLDGPNELKRPCRRLKIPIALLEIHLFI